MDFSEGLLLLTNDGELANHLLHPRYQHKKVYQVRLRGKVKNEELKPMREGQLLQDATKLLPADVKIVKRTDQFTLIEIVLRQGINRQIRKMCENLGLTVLSLKRVEVAGLKLGNLEPGKWRRLTKDEILKLKDLKKAASCKDSCI